MFFPTGICFFIVVVYIAPLGKPNIRPQKTNIWLYCETYIASNHKSDDKSTDFECITLVCFLNKSIAETKPGNFK